MMSSNRRHADITLQQIRENIIRLANVPGYRDIAKVLEANPAYYLRFVRDLTAMGGNIESLLKSTPPVTITEILRQTLHMILKLPSSMAGGMALAPSFSSSDAKPNMPEHSLRQSTPIGKEGSGETLEVVCESYTDYPNSVDMKVTVINPGTLKVGDHIDIILGSSGIDPRKVEFILKDDHKGGLRDRQLIAMQWEKLIEYGTPDGVEIEIDLPKRS